MFSSLILVQINYSKLNDLLSIYSYITMWNKIGRYFKVTHGTKGCLKYKYDYDNARGKSAI